MDQLIRHDKIHRVRGEVLTAYDNNKNIISLLMPGVSISKDKETLLLDLQRAHQRGMFVVKLFLDNIASGEQADPSQEIL